VIWVGTQDVGKNETNKGIHKLKQFIDSHSLTNFIVLSVPHRHDLDPNSCVNNEVKVFNRKLKKCLKLCINTRIIDIDSNRDLFTKHGLLLNSKGKEQIAKEIVKIIKCILNKEISVPIILQDNNGKKYNYNTTTQKTTLSTQSQYVEAPRIQDRKENKEDLTDNGNLGHNGYSDVGDISEIEVAETSEISKHYNMYEDRKEELLVSKDEDNNSSNLELNKLPLKHIRKPPNARYSDFLWLNI